MLFFDVDSVYAYMIRDMEDLLILAVQMATIASLDDMIIMKSRLSSFAERDLLLRSPFKSKPPLNSCYYILKDCSHDYFHRSSG